MSAAEVLTLLRELGTLFGLGERLVDAACQCRPELLDALSDVAKMNLAKAMADVDAAIDAGRAAQERAGK